MTCCHDDMVRIHDDELGWVWICVWCSNMIVIGIRLPPPTRIPSGGRPIQTHSTGPR